MTPTFWGSLVFSLVFLAIVHFLHDAINAEKWRAAARSLAIAFLLLLGAWIIGGGLVKFG